ncbi:hypothetical protein OnM2_c2088o84 [Erysiphe neolycopersici]|uniref:Uncharacterized protein n=1 Tax=Erysiphe neolycopersici TaxID=212602 RepID=A0A420I1H1_9PEZI|nr:hypothetical protein OnM2_c2088o84 [Erysiphe neolycopersici]
MNPFLTFSVLSCTLILSFLSSLAKERLQCEISEEPRNIILPYNRQSFVFISI